MIPHEPHFNGPEYLPPVDFKRLTNQLERVKACMADQQWRTLSEIEDLIGDPAASISAQLRHLRKERFGAYRVDRQPRGDRSHGLFEYRVCLPDSGSEPSTRKGRIAELQEEIKSLRRENDALNKLIRRLRKKLQLKNRPLLS